MRVRCLKCGTSTSATSTDEGYRIHEHSRMEHVAPNPFENRFIAVRCEASDALWPITKADLVLHDWLLEDDR